MSDTTFVNKSLPLIEANWLNEVNDHLYHDTPVTGATLHDAEVLSYTPAGSGAVETTVQAKLRESVSVADFGASPSATGAVNSAAFQAALDFHPHICIPPGDYALDSAITTTNKAVKIEGAGIGVTTLTFNGTNGLVFSQDNDSYHVTVCDLSLKQAGAGVGKAIYYDGSGQIVGATVQNRTSPRMRVENVNLAGSSTADTTGWEYGIEGYNLHHVTVFNVTVTGKYTTNLYDCDTIAAFYFHTDGNATEVEVDNCWAFYVQHSVKVSGIEGVFVTRCTFVAVVNGVTAANTSPEPHIIVSDSHIAAYTTCIALTYSNQADVHNNLLYSRSDGVTDATAISMVDCNYCRVTGNTVVDANVTYAIDGIMLSKSAATTSANTIIANNFQAVRTGISIGAGCQNNQVANNNYVTVVTRIIDSGIKTKKEDRFTRCNNTGTFDVVGTGAAVAATFNQVVSGTEENWNVADPTKITALLPGVYRVHAHAEFPSNATGIRRIEIRKNGVRSVGFPAVCVNAVSGYDTICNVTSGDLYLVGTDYITLVLAQSSGGDLTIAANYTWLSLEYVGPNYA